MMLQKKQQSEQMPVPTLGDVDAGALVAGSSQQTSVLEAVTRQEIDLQIQILIFLFYIFSYILHFEKYFQNRFYFLNIF